LNGLLMRTGSRVTSRFLMTPSLLSQTQTFDVSKRDRCAVTREIDYSADVPNGSGETIVHIGFRNEG